MKAPTSPLDPLLLTHDLACVLDELVTAARRYPVHYPGEAEPCVTEPPVGRLMLAAISFTIELAIEAGQDPAAMRSLAQLLKTLVDPRSAQPDYCPRSVAQWVTNET